MIDSADTVEVSRKQDASAAARGPSQQPETATSLPLCPQPLLLRAQYEGDRQGIGLTLILFVYAVPSLAPGLNGLSAEPLSDGRVKVWVHVADPTRWRVHLGSLMDM